MSVCCVKAAATASGGARAPSQGQSCIRGGGRCDSDVRLGQRSSPRGPGDGSGARVPAARERAAISVGGGSAGAGDNALAASHSSMSMWYVGAGLAVAPRPTPPLAPCSVGCEGRGWLRDDLVGEAVGSRRPGATGGASARSSPPPGAAPRTRNAARPGLRASVHASSHRARGRQPAADGCMSAGGS